MTVEELIAFERQIADDFESGLIKAPVHFSSGNEQQLIDIFKEIDKENDWVCCSWRSHFHCLLKGVPPEKLRQAILDGRSIALCFPEHKVISSALVGGIAPIAVGLALGLAKQQKPGRVWCFLGDMSMETGIAQESTKFAAGFRLPIHFVIEDNGTSVCTNTREAWGTPSPDYIVGRRYQYKLGWPHVSTGKWVSF